MKVIVKGPSLKRLIFSAILTYFLAYEFFNGLLSLNIQRTLLSLIFLLPLIIFLVKWIVEYFTVRSVKSLFDKAVWNGKVVLKKEVKYKKNYAVLINERKGLKTIGRLTLLGNWEEKEGKEVEVERWGFLHGGNKASLRATLLYFDNDVNVMLITPLNCKFEEKELVIKEDEGDVFVKVSNFIKVYMKVRRRGARGAKFYLRGETAYEGSSLFGITKSISNEIKLLEVKEEGEISKRLDVEEPIVLVFVAENLPKIFKLKKFIGEMGGNDINYFAKIVLDIPFAKDKVREFPLSLS